MLTAFKDENGFQIRDIPTNEFQAEDNSIADYCDALRIRASAKIQQPDFTWRITGQGPYRIKGERMRVGKKHRPES